MMEMSAQPRICRRSISLVRRLAERRRRLRARDRARRPGPRGRDVPSSAGARLEREALDVLSGRRGDGDDQQAMATSELATEVNRRARRASIRSSSFTLARAVLASLGATAR